MVARALFGLRAGVYGGWISKPGVDVLTAQPGQFMLDTNSQIFQTVLKGTTNLLTLTSGSVSAGYSISQNISLPAEFASFSRLIVNAAYSFTNSSVGTFDEGSITNSYIKWRVSGGILTITLTFTGASGPGSTGATYTYDANWSIFRAVF